MKRIRAEKKAQLLRLSRRRFEKRVHRNFLKKLRKLRPDEEYSNRLLKRRRVRAVVKTLSVPEKICFDENQRETIEFLNELYNHLENKGYKIRLDFSSLKAISPAAALMLASILCCWSDETRQQIILHDQTQWDPVMRHLLNDMGLFSLMKIKNPPSYEDKAEPEKEFLRFCHGKDVDASPYGPFREKIVEAFGPIADMKKLYKAISEAMTNSFQHAYSSREHDLGFGCWWMFGAFDWKTRELTIAFCDLGIGIPKALPRKYSSEFIREALSLIKFPVNDDARMIKAAMEIKRTQTSKDYRGKGMPGMKEIIHANPYSVMRVYSLGGLYEYGYGASERIHSLSGSLPGTLIEWRFQLSGIGLTQEVPMKVVA